MRQVALEPFSSVNGMSSPIYDLLLGHYESSSGPMRAALAFVRTLEKKSLLEQVRRVRTDLILEKPWERMTSQWGNVDWFCFWLKGEEDPNPAKIDMYARWRELRRLQVENEKKSAAPQPASN